MICNLEEVVGKTKRLSKVQPFLSRSVYETVMHAFKTLMIVMPCMSVLVRPPSLAQPRTLLLVC